MLFPKLDFRLHRTPLLRARENERSGILGFLLWPMADRLDVVAVRIEDESPIVARMVLGPKPRTTAVAPTRRHGHLMEGINSGALLGSRRDVQALTWLALADPEVRLARASESRCRDAGFHDQPVAQRGEGLRVEALALLDIRDGNTYVISSTTHTSHGARTEPTSVEPSISVTCSSTTANFRERFSSKMVSCPETADQTLDSGCKALGQAQKLTAPPPVRRSTCPVTTAELHISNSDPLAHGGDPLHPGQE